MPSSQTQAAVTSDIAHSDWPDDWPTLTDELLALISAEGSKEAVDGGMRVLNEFVGIDLTEDQLLPIARTMLPRMLEILGSPEVSIVRSSSMLVPEGNYGVSIVF